jgi:hypothetical protein
LRYRKLVIQAQRWFLPPIVVVFFGAMLLMIVATFLSPSSRPVLMRIGNWAVLAVIASWCGLSGATLLVSLWLDRARVAAGDGLLKLYYASLFLAGAAFLWGAVKIARLLASPTF